MSNSVVEVLQNYLDEINNKRKKGQEIVSGVEAEAKALDISIGTLSQLRNGKIEISDRVIDKIAKKLGGGDKSHEEEVRKKLENARSATSPTTAIDRFHRFMETEPGTKRLLCAVYHDIPQSRNKGRYPDLIKKSAAIYKSGVCCAMFQPFGPIDKIKEKVKAAYDKNDDEAIAAWNYIYGLVSGVHEVFKNTIEAVESKAEGESGENNGKEDLGDKKGQVILYEASEVPSLINCALHSRLFYSHQLSDKNENDSRIIQTEIRIVQLIQEKDDERFIECSTDSAFQTAFAAQFYPILTYWLKEGRLPTEDSQLNEYYADDERVRWKIYKED